MSNIWFPTQRVIRTIVQVVLSAATVLATVVLVAPQILTAIQDVLPGSVVAWIAGAIAVLAAISGAIARVMAIPAVNDWLQKFGAGSEPTVAIYHDVDGVTVGMTRRQWRAFISSSEDAKG